MARNTYSTQGVTQGPLTDLPVNPWANFSGYRHKKDPTLLPTNVLTYPTVNVFMPDGDKIIPRTGSKLLGQDGTLFGGMIGHYRKFKNISGIEMEVRAWHDNTLTFTGGTGTFVAGETITGGSSGATATVVSRSGSVLTYTSLVGVFTGGETVTGGTSGATGSVSVFKNDVIEVLYQNLWRQITPNLNTLTMGISRLGYNRKYFFEQWIDTNLDPALSINTNRLVWVMGLQKIRSSTIGIATIATIVVNTSLKLAGGITWSSLGFVDPANGGATTITVNGVTYTPTAGWGTDTLLVPSTTGISVGNLAFSGIQEVAAPVIFDYLSQFKNYVCYGNWFIQKVWIANNFNRSASEAITQAQAVQNDLVLDNSPYTGSGAHVYRVTIDSVNPPGEVQTFTPGGNAHLNDGTFITSGYTGAPGVKNNYKFLVVADYSISGDGLVGSFVVGETLRGSLSKAEGTPVRVDLSSPDWQAAIKLNTVVSFQEGETVTGLTSGATGVARQFLNIGAFEVIKNGVIVPTDVGFGALNINYFIIPTVPIPDGLLFKFFSNFGHQVGDTFELDINKGGADTFQWQIDGAAPVATHVPITGASQALSLGISITFVNKTGHTLGDYWEISVDQKITNAYANFYFNSNRKPGEGYIGQLPANFWTMAPQEDNMYINDSTGGWGYLETVLSADLLNETIRYVPLKQTGANKVIFPFMIGYLDNNLAYVTEGKWLDMIGRKKFLELPQTGHLSDPVKLDFEAATFENGSIEFIGMRFYLTTPKELLMFCYDLSQKYWQPPQLIPENGILSVVGNDLISHSNLKNRTNTLFVGTNDNGAPFPIQIRTGYNTYGNRWQMDKASMMFVEGYMQGDAKIDATVLQDVNGCRGMKGSTIEPVICIPSDKAPIGYGSLGSHSLGSDQPLPPLPYFQWIGVGQTAFEFYMAALDLKCESLDPQFQILSMALNTVASETNNSLLKRNQGTLTAIE